MTVVVEQQLESLAHIPGVKVVEALQEEHCMMVQYPRN